ncbi:MAG: STAS domain-containing protein [Proteobacteria bacterium]|nr:STAS domain-containing protein [Pseudomonadota bacterium]
MDTVRGPEKGKGVTVISAPRRLDAQQAGSFRAELRELADRGVFRIVADLSQTETIDSSGLGALVSRIAIIRENGGDMRLAGCNEFVTGLLNITHLDQVFTCYPTVEEAMKSFGHPPDPD